MISSKLIDGKYIAQEIRKKVARTIKQRQQQGIPAPQLAVIIVGDNPASHLYVRKKHAACQRVGIKSCNYALPSTVSEARISEIILELNNDPQINGILLQLPLPPSFNTNRLISHINPLKDVDGLTETNLGKVVLNEQQLRPCTALAVMLILQNLNHHLPGQHAVVVGASILVGKPVALELINAGCTVTVCHKFTVDLASYIKDADIVISAVGKPGVIDGNWLKPGAIVIDIGITMFPDGSITGDVLADSAIDRAAWLTPVPGGVGPVTVAVLMHNTLQAQLLQLNNYQ